MTTPSAEGLTPDLFGYVLCARCGTWRRAEGVEDGRCADVAWCGRQAGAGLGRLDADTGAASEATP